MGLTTDDCWDRVRGADHGVLCTTNAAGAIDAVPTCLAVVGERIATPIDTVKPKATTDLARRANLDRDPSATLLCEHWDAGDWTRLWWVRARLVRVPSADSDDVDQYEAALRAKYPQYATAGFAAVLVFDVADLVGWSAAG
ncbi:MAG TPA: hypothetical protein VIJ56_05635 [Acidimicrobiales bacterium]